MLTLEPTQSQDQVPRKKKMQRKTPPTKVVKLNVDATVIDKFRTWL